MQDSLKKGTSLIFVNFLQVTRKMYEYIPDICYSCIRTSSQFFRHVKTTSRYLLYFWKRNLFSLVEQANIFANNIFYKRWTS